MIRTRVDGVESHRPEQCAGCGARLAGRIGQAYTGYDEVDCVREGSGWTVRIPKRLGEECLCECGHGTRAEPARRTEDGGRRRGRRFPADWSGTGEPDRSVIEALPNVAGAYPGISS